MAGERPEFEAPLVVGAQIEVRAEHASLADRPFLLHGDRTWTFKQYRDESVRMAHFLLGRLGTINDRRPGHVGVFLENHLELLALYGGCGYAGLTLFGLNTGLRGDVLAGVINESEARVLVVEERLYPELERVLSRLEHVPDENVLVLKTGDGEIPASRDLRTCLEGEVGPTGTSLPPPDVEVAPES
ncbi:MAG: AMP-binding protein, partial [Myxococcota bacterium]